MTRRGWTAVVSLGAVGVLAAGLLYISTRPKPEVPAAPETTAQIWKFDKEKLARIVLSDRPEGTLVAEKKGTEWKLNYPYPVALNEFNLDQLKYSFADLEAERLVEDNPADLAKYGLQPPRAVAEAALDDGTVRTFLLGEPTPNGNSYYLLEKGDTRVYAVWKAVGEHFHWTASDLREKKIQPAIYSDEINYLLLKLRDGSQVEIRSKTKEERNDSTLGSGKYLIVKPFRYPRGVDSEKGVTFIRGTAAVEIAGFVDDAPKDLSLYGLDKPWCETIARDNAITLHFLFGSETAGDKVFFKIAGKPSVYTVDRMRLAYLGIKPVNIMDRRVFYPEIDSVDRIEISAAGATHSLSIARAQDQGGSGRVAYSVDGKALEAASFEEFYLALTHLEIDGQAEDAQHSAPVVRTRFILNAGAPRDVSIDYVPYNGDFYAVFVDGKGEFAVSKPQLDALLGAMDRLLAGQKASP